MPPPISFRSNEKVQSLLKDMPHVVRTADEVRHVKIENCIGFVHVPVGLAGPLHIEGPEETNDDFYVPLATSEAALVASCSRGCKAFNLCGGIQFEVLGEGMSRAPVFMFSDTRKAVAFARQVPALQSQFAKDAESTSRYVSLQKVTAHVIGSDVHVYLNYHCGDAAGQNMVTIATQHVCDIFLKSPRAAELHVKNIFIEGQMASDKKPSWGHVKERRGVEVIAWGTLSDSVCQKILGCSSESLYNAHMTIKEGGIRNGQFGSNINTANILAAVFIATGQDAASIAEGSWSQLTPEYNHHTKELKMTMYFPSLPVGVVGGGTLYDTQRECLNTLRCIGPGMKRRLAGLIAAFAIALDVSTSAAIVNNTFTQSHRRLARGKIEENGKSKL